MWPHDKARALLAFIRGRNTHIPIFLIARRGDASTLTSEVMREADELIWMLEDTTFFIRGARPGCHTPLPARLSCPR